MNFEDVLKSHLQDHGVAAGIKPQAITEIEATAGRRMRTRRLSGASVLAGVKTGKF